MRNNLHVANFKFKQDMTFSKTIDLQANDLNKFVVTKQGDLGILHNINLIIEKGSTVAIVGSSGSGKTTLLSLLAGLDTPSSGEIFLLKNKISELDEEGRAKIRRENIGFVFQSFQLIPGLTALENIMVPLEIKGVSRDEAMILAIGWLAKVGLEHRADHYPDTLSGGEQQRVALARAFVTQPKILFADEPTGSLDKENGAKVIELLFKLNLDTNCTLILVTHDQILAQQCDTIFKLQAGRLSS